MQTQVGQLSFKLGGGKHDISLQKGGAHVSLSAATITNKKLTIQIN